MRRLFGFEVASAIQYQHGVGPNTQTERNFNTFLDPYYRYDWFVLGLVFTLSSTEKGWKCIPHFLSTAISFHVQKLRL
jgi:hypothetical protein